MRSASGTHTDTLMHFQSKSIDGKPNVARIVQHRSRGATQSEPPNDNINVFL
jgi:hypothetical protein